jgi:PAS domain S-box-containing protein
MSLRRKLILLLSSLAVFAVVAAGVTIYGIQWQVQGAVARLHAATGRATQVDHLRFSLREQILNLRELVNGYSTDTSNFIGSLEAFLAQFRQAARYASEVADSATADEMLDLAEQLEAESTACLTALGDGRTADARERFDAIEAQMIPRVEVLLVRARVILHASRNQTTWAVGATSTQTLVLTLGVGLCAAGLVIIGATMIRKWLIVPIADLQEATVRFTGGDLLHRVQPVFDDELGRLGSALNLMAERVAEAQAHLQDSEAKHRTLFQNLRDAVVICDSGGLIIEYNDSDTQVLGVEGPDAVGKHILDVWPEWGAALAEWDQILQSVLSGRRFRAAAVELKRGDDSPVAVVDFLVYRIEFGGVRYASLVVRDVTDRQRLQRRLRRAETMEAVGTLAGGLAHDFNNLLASVTGTLSMLLSEVSDTAHAERLRTALRACWQAAGLSRRLLNFATSAHGDPQVFRPEEMVQLILESLDPSFLEGIELVQRIGDARPVRMDRDQFTQIVMNLLRNARDAMPDGGELAIELETLRATDPDAGIGEHPYTVLRVRDTGTGMTPEVQKRVFEPLFTTKSRAARRGRGLGLAIVYSSIKNAGGFVRIDSHPGRGTTFEVHIPIGEGPPQALPNMTESFKPNSASGRILLIDDDHMIRTTWVAALENWGYDVVALDGAEGAQTLRNGHLSVDVAIIDLHANEEGLALAEEVAARGISARIVLTTGATQPSLSAGLAPFVRSTLEKPFQLDHLASAITTALEDVASDGQDVEGGV